MSVSDQPISIAYASDGVSLVFAFPYYFRAFGDLVVTVKDSTGAVTTKVLTTDYSVSGVLDTKLNIYSAGGNITFLVAPAASGQVRITRRTPRAQTAVYNPEDPFPAGSHEAALDNLMIVIQELADSLGVLGLADGPPTSGSFTTGNILINTNPVPGGTWAWIYIAGFWYEMAQIAGS